MISYLGAGLGGALGLALGAYLLRRASSSKWGFFKSDKSLKGQVIIITGGNVGLGAATGLDLAKRQATVILACRSWQNTKSVLGSLRKESGNNDIHFIQCDLASLQSIKQFSEEFLEKFTRLDTLICNAGVWVPMEKRMTTQDSFEIHAGVNHLGHFYLTHLLMDKLQACQPSKVVVVSSSLMRNGRLDLANTDPFHEGRLETQGGHVPTGYADSKLMNVLFAKELAARYGESGVTAVSVCPGFCYTKLSRHIAMPLYKKILFLPIMLLFMRSAARGAHNIIHPAVLDPRDLNNGGFYKECRVAEPENSRISADLSDTGRQLWEISTTLCRL